MIFCKTFILLVIIQMLSVGSDIIRYDSYTGSPISEAEYQETIKKNTTFWCVTEIEPCDPDEGRRVDGSCNNLKYPSRGASHTPVYRILPAAYNTDGGGFEPRKASDGGPLPLARHLRTSFLPAGKVPDQAFTQLVTYGVIFLGGDTVSFHDTIQYLIWRPYCCLPKGKTDPKCTPNEIPVDDPVHRFSGIRCMNLTRPESFQSSGCVRNDTAPDRIVSSTFLLDLSHMYGHELEPLLKKGRKLQGGLLNYEIEEGRIWPPSTKTEEDLCLLNQKPIEKRCHAFPEGANAALGINIFAIWFWRNHNRVANALSKLNPCWDDDRLFDTARDINIATMTQIFYYELFPLLMGKRNLLRDSVISSSPGFRDLYDDQQIPQLSLEFSFALRWFHGMQESGIKMFDQNGHYLREYPIVNMTFRTGFLAVDNNIDYITQGSFRQPSGKGDYIVDPDLSEFMLGPLQLASDLFTNDLTKNRYFGFQPYVKYRQWCTGRSYKKFDDLKDAFDPERLELLRDRYKSVEDIDLMVGMWLEKHVKGGFIPETVYCLMTEQMLHFIVSDRHWYERPNRPNAFTLDQLLEIRKATISGFLCDVGDKVTRIQPHGFLRAGFNNQMCSCDEITKIDFSAWKDVSCKTKDNEDENNSQ